MKSIKINNKLYKDITKPEFWIGLTTILVLFVVIGMVGSQKLRSYQASLQQKEKIISPVPLADKNNEKKEITPTPMVTPVSPMLSQIKKLADTSGEITITAQQNDTFWAISQRMCGNGQYFKTIQELNGYTYKQLQAGDNIIIYCY